MSACLKQGSAEWLALRKTKITSTDACIIMGFFPKKMTLNRLFLQKLDLIPPEKVTKKMQDGNLNEEFIRQCLEKLTDQCFFPDVVFNPKNDWMMSSLDGITLDRKYICELKNTSKFTIKRASNKIQVPGYYYSQIQHHLACSQAEFCYYFPYFQGNTEYIEVYPNKEYIDSLISKEKEFYECLINRIPPPLTERDFAMRSDDIWAKKSQDWIEASNQLKIAEEKEMQAREALIQCAGRSNAMGAGIKLSKSIRKGNVEYSKIPELKGVDIDKYRKESIESFRIYTI